MSSEFIIQKLLEGGAKITQYDSAVLNPVQVNEYLQKEAIFSQEEKHYPKVKKSLVEGVPNLDWDTTTIKQCSVVIDGINSKKFIDNIKESMKSIKDDLKERVDECQGKYVQALDSIINIVRYLNVELNKTNPEPFIIATHTYLKSLPQKISDANSSMKNTDDKFRKNISMLGDAYNKDKNSAHPYNASTSEIKKIGETVRMNYNIDKKEAKIPNKWIGEKEIRGIYHVDAKPIDCRIETINFYRKEIVLDFNVGGATTSLKPKTIYLSQLCMDMPSVANPDMGPSAPPMEQEGGESLIESLSGMTTY
jgi:hypothetical protein